MTGARSAALYLAWLLATRVAGGARMSGPPPLRAENLTLAYDAHVVTRGLAVEIPEGGFTAIVGPERLRQVDAAAGARADAQAARRARCCSTAR